MEEDPLTQTPLLSTFRERRQPHKKSSINAVRESLSSRRGRRADTNRRTKRLRKEPAEGVAVQQKDCGGAGDDQQGEDKEEVERKIQALQRIVPGGQSLGVDKLFEETAGYIIALQCQLKAMRALTSLFEGLEKEKRKFGG